MDSIIKLCHTYQKVYHVVIMTLLCKGFYTIITNKKEDNIHPLLRKVNKIVLFGSKSHVAMSILSISVHIVRFDTL